MMNLRLSRSYSQIVSPLASRRGVALVITLILLAVISTLAIAFLGLTQRETSSVDSMGRTTDSEVAADSALERAKAEITAVYPFRNQDAAANGPNILGPGIMVSVCCQNYDTNSRTTTPYDRLSNPDARRGMRYDAAPPVFVQTKAIVDASNPLDDRFYLDLNRNGIFEDTGNVPDTTDAAAGTPGRFQFDVQAGNIVTNWRIGDPQWIGILQNPRRPHTNNNRFIGRYAYLVLPAGRALDINWIHNEGIPRSTATPGFYRNQGVGGWEVNLGALLADLNTNYWGSLATIPYGYATNSDPSSIGGSGVAFTDAQELLLARYGGAVGNLNRANQIFPPGDFTADGVDMFANGFTSDPNPDDNDDVNLRWPGSDGPLHFFSAHEFLNSKVLTNLQFRSRLQNASNRGNSYDRYTFYRMLSQMGTDSPEESDEELGKININYVNVGGVKASDLIPWTRTSSAVIAGGQTWSGPELFVNSVVTNVFKREFPALMDTLPPGAMFRIPVYVANSWTGPSGRYYSGRIHQIVQLAANILASTTGKLDGEEYPYQPFIFKPQFWVSPQNDVYITNYVRSSDAEVDWTSAAPRYRWRDLDSGERPVSPDDCVYGVPMIVSARKGYPAPSEFLVRTHAQFVRTIQMSRSTPGGAIDRTNQTLQVAITNVFGMEAWNSYATNYVYPRRLEIVFGGRISAVVTNSNERLNSFTLADGDRIPTNNWRGGQIITSRIVVQPVVTNWSRTTDLELGGVTNRWGVSTTNRMLFFLVDNDRGTRRIVDVVSLVSTNHFDINAELQRDNPSAGTVYTKQLWNSGKTSASQPTSLSLGVRNQIRVNTEVGASTDDDWRNYSALVRNKELGIQGWEDFKNNTSLTNKVLGFAAVRRMIQTNSFKVNDPLVHYLAEDMLDTSAEGTAARGEFPPFGLGDRLIGRYNPWGGPEWNTVLREGEPELDPMLRDPGMKSSDRWDFPTNKFPTIGWLGRVHRGTPWQSVYFKALNTNAAKFFLQRRANGREPDMAGTLAEMFQRWRAHARLLDDSRLFPTNDWRLADIFSTTIHPNAGRGRLSINQTNLAAWSAVLAGVEIAKVDNFDEDGFRVDFSTNSLVEPATYSTLIPGIVEGINVSRPARQFNKLSEIFAVPEITYRSPDLVDRGFQSEVPQRDIRVTDSDYERIPEKILSLLKVGEPRFVIYAWGQSLKPARLGFVAMDQPLSGPSINPDTKLVNNYQVTGEVATRAVVRAVFPERESNNPADAGYYRPDYQRPRLVVESFNIIPLE